MGAVQIDGIAVKSVVFDQAACLLCRLDQRGRTSVNPSIFTAIPSFCTAFVVRTSSMFAYRFGDYDLHQSGIQRAKHARDEQ